MTPQTLRTTIVAVALFSSFVLGGAACKSDEGVATGSTCPTSSTLTYETFGQTFVKTYCLDCHSSTSGRGEQPLLDTVAEIRANATEIDKTTAAGPNGTNTSMPENGSVAAADRTKLGEWLACGAP